MSEHTPETIETCECDLCTLDQIMAARVVLAAVSGKDADMMVRMASKPPPTKGLRLAWEDFIQRN